MATKDRALPRWAVALGPTKDTMWGVVEGHENTPLEAPGGVVLCWDQATPRVHPEAERAACSAWALLRRWQDQRTIPTH